MAPYSHADPTAWTAIANVNRERKKNTRPRRRNKQHAHSQVGVYRDNAHTTDKHPHTLSLVRPENISLRARIKYYEQKTASVKSMAQGQKDGMGPGSEK